jgi:glycosyltransferase involved in cell wall biosynthesis
LSAREVAERLAERPVFVSASRYEPFGLAVLEAARAGCALLLSDIPTFRELWAGAAAFVRPRTTGRSRARSSGCWRTPPSRPTAARPRGRGGRFTVEAMSAGVLAAYRPLPARRLRWGARVKIVVFTHSLRSCWNHGNAHFLRGVLRELTAAGHRVAAYEPEGAWSVANLLRDHGEAGLAASLAPYPELSATVFDASLDLDAALDGADAVLVHEWNEPDLVARIGRARRCGGRFTLLFHDTHHRAVSDPDAIRRFDLDGYDGVLAFGETLAAVYRRWDWGDRVFVWHEAADTRLFHPPLCGKGWRWSGRACPLSRRERDGVRGTTSPQGYSLSGAAEGARTGRRGWPPSPLPLPLRKRGVAAASARASSGSATGATGERSAELDAFLFRPAQAVGLPLDVYGVRYPPEALAALDRAGARYRGWLPTPARPRSSRATSPPSTSRAASTSSTCRHPDHPRLRGPGLRHPARLRALAGQREPVPAGRRLLVAPDGPAMERHLRALRDDPCLAPLACGKRAPNDPRPPHLRPRARELLDILHGLRASAPMEASA